MPTGQYTAADLDAPKQSGQQGQFTAADIDAAPQSAASRFRGSFARGMGIVSPEEGKNFFTHPIDTLKGMGEAQADLGRRAGSEFKGGDYLGAATHGVEYLLPGLGPTLAHAGDQLESGDTAGGIGTTLGAGTTIAAGSPEARATAAKAVPPVVRTAGKVLNSPVVLPAVGTAIGHAAGEGTAGAIIGHGARGLLSKLFGKMEKYGLPEESPAPTDAEPTFPGADQPQTPPEAFFQGKGLREGGKPGVDSTAGLGSIPVRGSIAKAFKDPGAPLPEAPAPEVTQAQSLFYGGKPAADPAAGLGKIPVRGAIAAKMSAPTNAEPSPIAETPAAQQSAAPPPAPRPIARGTLSKMMDKELGNALGAKQLDPKVPLRGQLAAKMPPQSEAAIPEGHTPVESSALRSYKYDPAAREFHARATSGNTVYVYGDVAPEDAAAFEKATSKGQAWGAIRRNPLVAKIVDGKRVATTPARATAD